MAKTNPKDIAAAIERLMDCKIAELYKGLGPFNYHPDADPRHMKSAKKRLLVALEGKPIH